MKVLTAFGVMAGVGALSGAGMDQVMQHHANRLEAKIEIIDECRNGEREIVRVDDGLECDGVRIYEPLGEVALEQPVQIDWFATEEAVQDRIDAMTFDRVTGDAAAVALASMVAGLGLSIWGARQRLHRNRGGVIRGSMVQ